MLATAFANEMAPPDSINVRATTRSSAAARSDAIGLASRLPIGATRLIEAKEHLFREGDRACSVYLVEAGHMCIYRMMPDGRRQVIDFAYPGDVIGLGALGHHAANAQATVKTRLRCIPVATLHEFASRDSSLGRRLYEALSRELLAAREHLFTVSQCTAAERLASFLLALSRRNERRGEDAVQIVLPMTRIDIADFLGLTIETVSRTFTRFKSEGLIDVEHCILVTIRNPQALAEAAGGECATQR